jgi:hypothetical protein
MSTPPTRTGFERGIAANARLVDDVRHAEIGELRFAEKEHEL